MGDRFLFLPPRLVPWPEEEYLWDCPFLEPGGLADTDCLEEEALEDVPPLEDVLLWDVPPDDALEETLVPACLALELPGPWALSVLFLL